MKNKSKNKQPSNRELMFSITKKDFDIEHIRGSGPGGQHRNKTSTGIRLKHIESGIMVTATDSRSQEENLRNAFKRLTSGNDFQAWLRMRIAQEFVDEQALHRKVQDSMRSQNIKVEAYENGSWIEVEPGDSSESTRI